MLNILMSFIIKLGITIILTYKMYQVLMTMNTENETPQNFIIS